jgi:hypothetical protein
MRRELNELHAMHHRLVCRFFGARGEPEREALSIVIGASAW